MSSECRRIVLTTPPFPQNDTDREWNRRGEWPAQWITCRSSDQVPLVAAYRVSVEFEYPRRVLIHTTADERYRLFLNGKEIGNGSERGDLDHWYFETYEISFPAGKSTLVAQVWSLGPDSPYAQFSLRHGFLLCPNDLDLIPALATGHADWTVNRLPGYRFTNPQCAWGTGFNLTVSGSAFAWGFTSGAGEGWVPAKTLDPAVGPAGVNDKSPRHLLIPATLPPMVDYLWGRSRVRHVSFPGPGSTAPVPFRPEENLADEVMDWTRLILGNPLTVPPNTRRRVLLDLHDYVCAFPEIIVSKGRQSEVRINWQEALFDTYQSPNKGNRDAIENKFFCTISGWDEGVGDTFLPDGGAHRAFTTLWWQAGRYVEVLVQTEAEELIIESLNFRENHYPFENQLKLKASDDRLAEVGKLAFRTLQMCAHETYMDCPFYEQLQYIGDTRLQVLVSYVVSGDDRLARKALQTFDASRRIDGITQSRYPSRVVQVIPPFSLWWVCMIWDFALWRGDKEFVRTLMPGARMVLDWFRKTLNSLGLVEAPLGWNFVDWVPAWSGGMPLGGDDGVSCVLNRQFEIALRYMAQLEKWIEEPEMAQRHQRSAEEVAAAIHRTFWNSKKGIYADDIAHSSYSEHAQILSVLTDALPEKIERMVTQGLLSEPELHRTTVYFSHYLFECLARVGRTDRIRERMGLWFDHLGEGMKTIKEMPEPTRSDCHAWGAHPLYHYIASFLGAKPKGLGSKELLICPNLGGLDFLEASFPFATGQPKIKVSVTSEGIDCELKLPEGVTATVFHKGKSRDVGTGETRLRLP